MKNYLAHHGVAGQKWGQRHGPPYPLSRDPANAKRAQADHKKNKTSTKTSSNSPRVSRGTTPSNMQVHVMKGIISDRKYRKELAKKQKQEQEEYEKAQRAEKAAAVKRRKYLEKEAKKGRLTRDEQEEYTELVWSDKRQAEAEAARQQAQQEKYKNAMQLVSSAAVMTQKVALAAERIGYAKNALSMLSEKQKDRNQALKIRKMELDTDIAKTKINAEKDVRKEEVKQKGYLDQKELDYELKKKKDDISNNNKNKDYSKRVDTKWNDKGWRTNKKMWSTNATEGSYTTYDKDKKEWSINKDSIDKNSLFTVSKDKDYSKRLNTKDKSLQGRNKWTTPKKLWSTNATEGSYTTYSKDKKEWSINKDSIDKNSLFTVSKDKKYTTWNDVDIGAKNKDGTYKYNDVISDYRRSQSYQKTMKTKLSSAYSDYTKSKYVSYADLQPSIKSIKVSESSLNRIKEAQQRRTRMEEISRQKAMTQALQRDFLNSKGNKKAYYSMKYPMGHSMFLSPEEQMLLYLAHHGVAGQKWGQRHGPPYPLSRNPANAKRARVDYKQNSVHVNKGDLGRGIKTMATGVLGIVGGAALGLATGGYGTMVGLALASVATESLMGGHKTRKSERLTDKRDKIVREQESNESKEQKDIRKKKQQAIFDADHELYANFNPLESTNTAKLEYSSTTNKRLQKALEIKRDTKISDVLGSKNQTLASKTPEKISHGVNPNYSKTAAGYRDNCLKCSLTMEMRMRGYDVQAKASSASETKALSEQSTSGLMAHFTKTPDTYAYSKFTRSKTIIKEKDFINSLPDGRYMVNGPTNTGSGHSIYGIKKDGKITYYDTQSNNGTAYSFFNAESGKSIGKELINNSRDNFPAEFVRLDNLSESDFYNISDYCEKSK